jgi:hypothetical protein
MKKMEFYNVARNEAGDIVAIFRNMSGKSVHMDVKGVKQALFSTQRVRVGSPSKLVMKRAWKVISTHTQEDPMSVIGKISDMGIAAGQVALLRILHSCGVLKLG